MEKELQNDEMEIDLLELFYVLMNKLWIIILCGVVGAVVAFSGTKLLITPQYTASSMIYILSETTSITSLADIQLGASLAEDFIVIGKSRPVIERVIRQLDLETNYEELASTISIVNETDTHILTISVTNPDPELAADISNTLAENIKEQIADIMGTEEPNTVEEAVVPTKPSSPSTMKNTLMGGALGVLLVSAVIILLHLLDDTIKNEEDVKKYLGLNTLAAIPLEKRSKKSGNAA